MRYFLSILVAVSWALWFGGLIAMFGGLELSSLAFYVAAYGSLSVPAVLAGVVVTHLGLQTTFEVFGSVVAALALVVAFEAWRTQPRRMLVRQEVAHAQA